MGSARWAYAEVFIPGGVKTFTTENTERTGYKHVSKMAGAPAFSPAVG